MMTVVNLGTVSATGTATSINVADRNRLATPVNSGVVQVAGNTNYVFTLEGSCDNSNWVSIATGVAGGSARSVVMMPWMRANCTTTATGSATIFVTF